MQRNSVLFPVPEGPMMATVERPRTSKEMFLSTGLPGT
jgi:hypothetical protein